MKTINKEDFVFTKRPTSASWKQVATQVTTNYMTTEIGEWTLCEEVFFPSANVLSAASPFLTVWRSFLHERWIYHKRYNRSRSHEEVLFTIGELTMSVTIILGQMKSLFFCHWRMPYQRHLYSRQYEEVFFVIGECTISGITILDHKKSFLCHCWMNHHRHPHYWPNADVFFAISKSVVGLTILTTWRSFFAFSGFSIIITTIEEHMKKFS